MTFEPGRQDADGSRALRWRLHPLGDLHWRRWDDEWVVFDVGSGQTHRLGPLDAVALLVIEELGEPTLPALTKRVAEELQVDPTFELSAALSEVMDRQSVAGLVEPVDR